MEGGTLRLADFDAGHDIVDFRTGEYILKPRLAYFDLDNAGTIVGKLAFASAGLIATPRFVIKAERLASDGTNTYHVVRRWTVPQPDGSFFLYPVSTLVTSTWNVVIRGLDYQTVIIKGVPITKGATPTNGATDLGTITMTAAGRAILYDRSANQMVFSASVVSFGSLTVSSPYQGNTVSGAITMINPPKMDNKMDKGVLFAVRGGMIVNAMNIDSQMSTGGTYTMSNVPGGSSVTPLPGAFYGIEAFGWSSAPMPMSIYPYKAIAIPKIVDLRTGKDTADMLVPLW